jgi:hypothetical protein
VYSPSKTAHHFKMRKPTIVKNAQCRARVLSSLALGLRDEKRWIVQEDCEGADIGWVDGSAQPSLLQESKGYVRPVVHRTVQKSVYDKAPIHRVEIWCHAPNSEFHVRIFDEITECAPFPSNRPG